MSEGHGLFVGWYDTDPSYQPELDLWHSKEHMPERAELPGFLTLSVIGRCATLNDIVCSTGPTASRHLSRDPI